MSPATPTLAQVLSLEALRRAAGARVFADGQAVCRAGHVVEVTSASAAEVSGRVLGNSAFEVSLRSTARGLVGCCSCRLGGRLCKHIVAVAVAFIEAPPAGAPPPRAEASFASQAQLLAWAATHQVAYALAYPISLIPDATRRLPFWAIQDRALTVGRAAVTASPPDRWTGVLRGAELVVARAARSYLETEAAHVQAGIEEEAARPASVRDPRVAAAWRQVAAARAVVRADAVPRGQAFRGTGRLASLDDGERLRWQEPGHEVMMGWRGDALVAACSCQRPAFASAFNLRPGGPDGAGLAALPTGAAAGDAAGPAAGRCVHVLAALDATLDHLGGPDREAAATLARGLTCPTWQRALTAMATVVAPTPSAPGPELWWQLRLGPAGLELAPVLRKPGKKGLSRGQRVSPDDILRMPAAVASRTDVAAAVGMVNAFVHGTLAAAAHQGLTALIGHPRVIADDRAVTPITVRRATMRFEVVPEEPDLRVVATIAGRPVPRDKLREAAAADALGWVDYRVADATCLVIDTDAHGARLLGVLNRHGDRFPPEAHAALLERLDTLTPRVPVDLPAAVVGDAWPTRPIVVVRVTLVADGGLDLAAWLEVAADAPLVVPGEGRAVLPLVRDGQRGHLPRDLAAEPALVRAALAALPVTPVPDEGGEPWRFRVADVDDAVTLALAFDDPPPGVRAEWIERKPTVHRGVGAAALSLRVTDKKDWFDIDGAVEVDGQRLELAVVLEAIRAQRRYVRVGDGRWIELAAQLRAQLAALAAHRTRVRGQAVTSMAAAPAVLDLVDAGAAIDGSAAWMRLVARVRDAAQARPRVPRGVTAKLRDYQQDGFAWMTRLAAWGAGGCLADDMGLGKTVQTITLLAARAAQGPALVIAPTSVVSGWVAELGRFAPKLRAVVLGERDARGARIDEVGAGDVLITSYALLARELPRLVARRFATLVFDEAQAIKNPATQRAQAARALDAEFRLALTGTPMENRVGELWAVFAAVFPPLLGQWEQFRETYATPIERDRDPAAQAALARLLRPFVLRRRKHEVARELPARTEIALEIARSDAEVALYEDVRLAAIAKLKRALPDLGAAQQRIQILAELTRLRLAACHPRLHDPTSTVPSAKLERLLELVEDLRAEGHRALVFSQFVTHLALVREALDAAGVSYQYLDGATPAAQRGVRVDAFQAGQGDLFLISLKAGGTGLNLTAADYVIHLDPWWNPAVEDQASDRAHRIGQTRPVTIYRLIAADTIEAKILSLHAAKRELAAGILEGTDGALGVSPEDLLDLIGAPGAAAAPARPSTRNPAVPVAARAAARRGAGGRRKV